MKRLLLILLVILLLPLPALAADSPPPERPEEFDLDAQMEALGTDELLDSVPEETRELLSEVELDELSPERLLQLSPREFFAVVWRMLLREISRPMRVFASVLGILLLCALLGGLRGVAMQSTLSPAFGVVAVLCVITAVVVPLMDCILATSRVIRDVSLFMMSFIPMFGAALAASGHPVTGFAYNSFLLLTCQVVAQVAAKTLVPLMGIYLALCVTGAVVPELNIGSVSRTVKKVVNWTLGFMITLFIGLLSVQTLVSHSADSLTSKTAKFVIGSFVPVVGGALSEAFYAARGCLQLVKTALGAYGILVALFIFLPVLLQLLVWCALANLTAMGSDVLDVKPVGEVLRACAGVLGMLIAVVLCYALLVIVSTTVILVVGMGTV